MATIPIKIDTALPKTLTFEILGSEYALKVSPKRLAQKAIQLQSDTVKMQAVSTPETFTEAYDAVEAAAVGIVDEMFGEGSAAKMTGGVEVTVGWYSNLISAVLTAAADVQNTVIAERYA